MPADLGHPSGLTQEPVNHRDAKPDSETDMRATALSLFLLLLPLAPSPSHAAAAPGQPVAPVKEVDDTYWGVKVADPYRYMEDLKSPHVQGWMKGQAAYTDSVLSRIPIRDEILARSRIWMPDARTAWRRSAACRAGASST